MENSVWTCFLNNFRCWTKPRLTLWSQLAARDFPGTDSRARGASSSWDWEGLERWRQIHWKAKWQHLLFFLWKYSQISVENNVAFTLLLNQMGVILCNCSLHSRSGIHYLHYSLFVPAFCTWAHWLQVAQHTWKWSKKKRTTLDYFSLNSFQKLPWRSTACCRSRAKKVRMS